jgi:hypothetical protein
VRCPRTRTAPQSETKASKDTCVVLDFLTGSVAFRIWILGGLDQARAAAVTSTSQMSPATYGQAIAAVCRRHPESWPDCWPLGDGFLNRDLRASSGGRRQRARRLVRYWPTVVPRAYSAADRCEPTETRLTPYRRQRNNPPAGIEFVRAAFT